MRKLTPLALACLLLAGCGASPAATRTPGPAQPAGALQTQAAKKAPAYGKVLQFALQGFDQKVSIDGETRTVTLDYTAWLQAGPDRLGAVFTKQEVVTRTLTLEARKAGATGWEVRNLAVQTRLNGNLTLVKDGKQVPGVAPGLKSIDTELQALVALIQKNRVWPENPRGEKRAAILEFAETFRSFVVKP